MEILRSYRLLIVVVVLVFFGVSSPLVAKIIPEVIDGIRTSRERYICDHPYPNGAGCNYPIC